MVFALTAAGMTQNRSITTGDVIMTIVIASPLSTANYEKDNQVD